MIQWARRGNRQKGERWLRAILALLLVVFLAYVIARTAWMLWYGPLDSVPESDLQQVTVAGSRQGTSTISSSQVQSWNLFGVYQAEPDALDDRPVDAPDTLGKMLGPDMFQALREQRGLEHDGLLLPQEMAETYYHIAHQHRSAWTHELDLRAFSDLAWWNHAP